MTKHKITLSIRTDDKKRTLSIQEKHIYNKDTVYCFLTSFKLFNTL